MTGTPDTPWSIHGDQQDLPGMLDFAVNVCQPSPPPVVLNVLEAALPQLAHYPRHADYARVQEASLFFTVSLPRGCFPLPAKQRPSIC